MGLQLLPLKMALSHCRGTERDVFFKPTPYGFNNTILEENSPKTELNTI